MALMRSARTGTCRMWEICCNRLAPMRLVPLLVFLHLLERKAEFISQIGLAHVQHDSAHSHPIADVFIDGVGGFFSII